MLVDPEVGLGQPVVDGTGVRTEILREQFVTGRTHAQIAADFDVSSELVEKALQFEARHHEVSAAAV